MYHLLSVRLVFLASIVIFEIGSLISGAAPTSWALILGRTIAGLGCAGIIAGAFTFVSFHELTPYPAHEVV